MRCVAILLSFAGLLPFAPSVQAHGADWELRMVGQRVGGYDVTVRTAPKQPRKGRLRVEVQLLAPESLTYIERATVTATARFRGGETIQTGLALSRYRQQWHEMELSLKKSGPWDVLLAVNGPRGQEKFSFRVDVVPEGIRPP